MKDRIRLCYIGDGRSIHTQRWVNHFSDLGYDVHLISDGKVNFEKATVHLIEGTGNITFIKKIFKCRKLIKQIKPDIIHAHFVTNFGFLGAMTGFHPFVVSPWGSDIVRQPEESALFKFMVKYALKKADAIQCVDENIATRVKWLIGDRGNIRIVGWGVDTELFKPARVKINDEIRILYLRISHVRYYTSVLLEAMPKILKKHDNVKFIILKKGEHLDRTLEVIKNMGMDDKIELIEFVPHDKLPDLLNRCDIYMDTFYNLLPGSGIGITTLEAMSCGVPIIMTNTNGYQHYIKHKVSGYIYNGGDPKALALAIEELILDPELRENMGKNARAQILEKLSWQENMNEMDKLYRELINKGDEK